jgi:lipopolysaccharide transport system ATP-binding protein
LRMMAGVHSPTNGRVVVNGRISALLELGAGFHPELTGRENIYLNASILGLSRKQTDGMFDQIVEFSGLAPFIDSPVKHYSSGMYVRLGFSVAVHVDPQILLIDEVIAVGDEEFQRRCLDHLASLKDAGVTIVFVSHALGIVMNMCDTASWLDHGRVMADGKPMDVVGEYLHGVNDLEAERDLAESKETVMGLTGAGALTVDGVALIGVRDTEVPFGLSGDPLSLRVDWTTDGSVPAPRLAIQIESEGGIHLATIAAEDGGRSEPTEAGPWSRTFRVDELPLAAGSYSIRVVATDPMTHSLLDRSEESTFTVRSEERIIDGMFDIPGEWADPVRRSEAR